MKKIPLLSLAALCVASMALDGCEGCHDHDHAAPHDDEAHGVAHTPHAEHGAVDNAHAHDHGEESISITRWTEKLELFAEHPPAVVDRELSFLAHLTLLEGFKALDDATVTLVLEGPVRVEARVTEKLRPGIFKPTLTAPPAGTYRGQLVVTGPEVTDTIDGFDVVVHSTVEAAEKAAASKPDGGREPIRFLKEQQWQVPFKTVFASLDEVLPTLEVAGEVTTPPSGQADVGAAIAGRVVAPEGGLPRPGQAVRRGQLLATIAPAPAAPEAGARAELAVVEAEARVQAARAAVERAERLIADRAISQREVDEARRELGVAQETVLAAQRARDVFSGAASGRGAGTYRMTAPIEGVVVEVDATEGRSVQVGEPMFRIVNLSELWVRARVPEQQAALIRPEQNAAMKLPGLDDWLPLEVSGANADAAVVTVGRTVDRRSRTVDVIYALRAPDERLRVGAMLRVAVPAGQPWDGVVIPRSAVIEDDGRAVVYVQVEGEAFEERTVRIASLSGARVGIESGVNDGERVVTLGANVIRLSSRAATSPAHGHVH